MIGAKYKARCLLKLSLENYELILAFILVFLHIKCCEYCLFFFFFLLSFLATPRHTELPGQGLDLSCAGQLCHSCSNTGSLIYCMPIWGSNLCPRAPET